MVTFTTLDFIAVGWFFTAWAGFSLWLEYGPAADRSLSAAMDRRRRQWLHVAIGRENRIVDTHIMSNLMNGTAFFASATIFALGGCFALLGATDRVMQVMADLPWITTTRGQWEVKVMGLIAIFAYGFFKFGWAYRLFTYCSVLLGSIPIETPDNRAEAEAAADRTARMNALAARHFNRGLRAFFFALGYLGWFAGPQVLLVTATCVLWTVWRRQFASRALEAAQG